VYSPKTRGVIAVLILLVSLAHGQAMAGGIWPAGAQEVQSPAKPAVPPGEFKAGEILVKFKEQVSTLANGQALAESVLQQYDATYVRSLYGIDIELWQVPEGSELATVERLNANPLIEYAEPNYRVYAAGTVPNDPSFGKQWAHTIMQSPAAWDITTGKANVTIAILDTGIDETHPDLASKIVPGYDFVDNDSNPHDENGHGTHCAGIAAAVTNNGVGVAGMNWRARIMPIRVLDEEGYGYTDIVAEGIFWAYPHGAKVINLSLVVVEGSLSLRDAVNAAHAAGSLVVASMGNHDTNQPVYPAYPAAYHNVLAVAATGPDDLRADYSNYGSHCDVAAPGGNRAPPYHDPRGIYSTMPTYPVYMTTHDYYYMNYDYMAGTSQAAPYVAGLAALLWALEPSLTPDQVEATIENTAVDKGAPGWDPYYGHGRVNALAALRAYSRPVAPVLSSIGNTDGDGAYLVDWNDVQYATAYRLEEDDDPLFPTPVVRYSGGNSQFQVTGQPGGTWYYRVRASNGYGDSPWSNMAWVIVKPAPPILLPINNPGNGDEYLVAWLAASGAALYNLEQDIDSGFSNPIVRYKGTSLQYNVTGQPGGTWYYRVRATNAAGDGDWSIYQFTTVDPAALSPPELIPIDNSDGDREYLVDWLYISAATSYALEQSLDPYFATPTEVYSGTESEFLVTGQPGGTWYYRVRAFGVSDKSPWSDQQKAVVPVWGYFPFIAKKYSLRGIENGDFEAGSTSWTEFSSNGYDLILPGGFPEGVAPHSGSWAVWLGGDHNETAYIEQQVSVPVGRPYLQYWHWIVSEDYCGFDLASVRVDGVQIETYDLCISRNTGGWVLHTVNLGSFAGQSIALQIRVKTDDSLLSSLYVDDVSFTTSSAVGEATNLRLEALSTSGPVIGRPSRDGMEP
jgi:thermitase